MAWGVARSRASTALLTAACLLLVFAATAVCAVLLHTHNVSLSSQGNRQAVQAAQTAMYVVAMATMLLASVALILGARLVASMRAQEVWWLRARGFSASQVQAVTGLEALVVALPAMALAPFAAAGVLLWTTDSHASWLYGVGPWLWAVSAGVGCAGAVALMLVNQRAAAHVHPEASGSWARLRTGVDVSIAALALLALWQLLRDGGGNMPGLAGASANSMAHAGMGTIGGSAGASAGGLGVNGLGVDLVIVAAPGLVLLAGALLSLRLISWLSRQLDRAATASAGVSAPLGMWQMSRRMAGRVGPALLLVLAVGLGAVSLTYTASWRANQLMQAEVATGAMLSVGVDVTRQGAGTGDMLAALPGIDAVMPVFSQVAQGNEVLAFPAEQAGAIVTMPSVMVEAFPDFTVAMDALVDLRPQAQVVALPDATRSLDVQLVFGPQSQVSGDDVWRLSLVLQDRFGLLHRLPRAVLVADADANVDAAAADASLSGGDTGGVADAVPAVYRASIDVGRSIDGAWGGSVSGASIIAVELEVIGRGDQAPTGPGAGAYGPAGTGGWGQQDALAMDFTLSVSAVTDSGDSTVLAWPTWKVVVDDSASPQGWEAGFSLGISSIYGSDVSHTDSNTESSSTEPGRADFGSADSGQAAHLDDTDDIPLLAARGHISPVGTQLFTLRPVAADDQAAGQQVPPPTAVQVPALTTSQWNPASTVVTQVIAWEPVGGLLALPGQGLHGVHRSGMVADLPTLALAVFEGSGNMVTPTFWWLSAEDGQLDAAVAALDVSVFGPVLTDAALLESQWQADPLGLSVVETLNLTLGAAVVFAAISIALSTVVATRQRRGELAVLRAMGTHGRQIIAAVITEHALMMGTAVLLGGGLGIGLAHLLLPRLVRDVYGGQPMPPVATVLPWASLAALVLAVASVTAVALVLVVRSALKSSLADVLREQVA